MMSNMSWMSSAGSTLVATWRSSARPKTKNSSNEISPEPSSSRSLMILSICSDPAGEESSENFDRSAFISSWSMDPSWSLSKTLKIARHDRSWRSSSARAISMRSRRACSSSLVRLWAMACSWRVIVAAPSPSRTRATTSGFRRKETTFNASNAASVFWRRMTCSTFRRFWSDSTLATTAKSWTMRGSLYWQTMGGPRATKTHAKRNRNGKGLKTWSSKSWGR
mmetsp:Transcript_3958/g.13548  ORF Transcript_3958/g.13548 Transcript_3958/m.13548 type:complete len:223 (-) Transcript_3958:140-808(-)